MIHTTAERQANRAWVARNLESGNAYMRKIIAARIKPTSTIKNKFLTARNLRKIDELDLAIAAIDDNPDASEADYMRMQAYKLAAIALSKQVVNA